MTDDIAMIAQVKAALEFYADPGKTADQTVPDFYRELDYGETASAALEVMPRLLALAEAGVRYRTALELIRDAPLLASGDMRSRARAALEDRDHANT